MCKGTAGAESGETVTVVVNATVDRDASAVGKLSVYGGGGDNGVFKGTRESVNEFEGTGLCALRTESAREKKDCCTGGDCDGGATPEGARMN